jgi:hypothetical protein
MVTYGATPIRPGGLLQRLEQPTTLFDTEVTVRACICFTGILFLLLAVLPPSADAAEAREGRVLGMRNAPSELFMAKRGLERDLDGKIRLRLTDAVSTPSRKTLGKSDELSELRDFSHWSRPSGVEKLSATLNCGNDNIIDAAGTLVLEPGDAAGTAFNAPPEVSALRVDRLPVMWTSPPIRGMRASSTTWT